MHENSDPVRIGEENNRKFEEEFFAPVQELPGATLGDVAVQGDVSFSKWIFDCALKDSPRVATPQVTRRKWRNGKVMNERFYHA
jgi:hypothetical protein